VKQLLRAGSTVTKVCFITEKLIQQETNFWSQLNWELVVLKRRSCELRKIHHDARRCEEGVRLEKLSSVPSGIIAFDAVEMVHTQRPTAAEDGEQSSGDHLLWICYATGPAWNPWHWHQPWVTD
jgi:hypothetical protein